jgi:hypothetical protein
MFALGLRDCHPLRWSFPARFGWVSGGLNTGPTTPEGQAPLVWAGPRSLAATDGVAFAFLSWGY